jgi:hypothetical protein
MLILILMLMPIHKKRHENKQLSIKGDGYLTLIDAPTSDTDALTLAPKNAPGTFPLHTIRFLEVISWDDLKAEIPVRSSCCVIVFFSPIYGTVVF